MNYANNPQNNGNQIYLPDSQNNQNNMNQSFPNNIKMIKISYFSNKEIKIDHFSNIKFIENKY